jgi:spermidine/putrescine ABC transporter ATP-binding subunit
MSYLAIEGVSKSFGAVAAVNDVGLEIRKGEFFSLLGPSGCGKTTLLRMIAGFEQPDRGTILIEGADVTSLPPEKRPTNMVFQSYAIFPHLDVFQNVAYGLRRAKLTRAERERRVGDALAMVRLEGYGKRKSHELSGGQRQRVALARALVRSPKVLLLDEPLGALDRRLRGEMQEELRQLQARVGITFVFVTHDQEEALSMSSRVAVMSKGKVLQTATPQVLYAEPNCREVAEFIGTMNFIDGTILSNQNGAAIVGTRALGPIEIRDPPAFASRGARIVLAIRPENLFLAESSTCSATVVSSTFMGARCSLLVAVEGPDKALAIDIGLGAEASPSPGTRVKLGWHTRAFTVFPQ